MLNIDGFEVDRSNLQRIFAAHILKDERSVMYPHEGMDRKHIDPLVDTLLKHFGKPKKPRGCCSDEGNPKKLSQKEVKIVPLNSVSHKLDQPSNVVV